MARRQALGVSRDNHDGNGKGMAKTTAPSAGMTTTAEIVFPEEAVFPAEAAFPAQAVLPAEAGLPVVAALPAEAAFPAETALPAEAGHTLTFLGTGAACGVPSFYCGCKACEEARVNPRAARDCSGLLIAGLEHTLIDTAPELRTQLVRERITHIDRVLFTHEHFDHVGGLPQLEFFVHLELGTPVPIYASEKTLAAIGQQFAFMSDVLVPHLLEPFVPVCFDGVRYTPLPAVHGEGTFGFLIEIGAAPGGASAAAPGEQGTEQEAPGAGRQVPSRIAYFPDTGPLLQQTLEYLSGLDLLIIDATFNGANWMPVSHHSIGEAIAFSRELAPRCTYLTHLAMHYDEPITLVELEEQLKPYRGTVRVAFDGLHLAFPTFMR
jgi:phosphoribosyl 1,2-cyclic phosphate phosphodiesterase